METVQRNAQMAFRSRFQADHSQGVQALALLRDALDLDEAPYRIEAFDISHLQGTAVVASMVVWEGGRAQRAAYRHFKVKTVEGQDDFASMAEVVGLRYRRLVKEERRMPDLILIDGGKGQLSAAHRALKESGAPPVPMAALAKREEEIFLPGRPQPIRLERSSAALQLLQQVRDEAHRFAVTYHRKVRSRTRLTSELEAIPGVGRARAGKLLTGLGSLRGVQAAGEDELAALVPRRVARAIQQHFRTPAEPPKCP
jgi:excinuclease ABC subunit C